MTDHDPLDARLRALDPMPDQEPRAPSLDTIRARTARRARRDRRARFGALAAVGAVVITSAVALAPGRTPGGEHVVGRALATTPGTGVILHFLTREITEGRFRLRFTSEVWVRVDGRGAVREAHDIRLAGDYRGIEKRTTYADPPGRNTIESRRDRSGRINHATGPTTFPTAGLDVINAIGALRHGALRGTVVELRGRPADRVVVHEQGPAANPKLPIPYRERLTMWFARDTGAPLQAYRGDGDDETTTTVTFTSFERLADTAVNRRELELLRGR